MTKGRKEIPPSEQLWGLRMARDRYIALADQLRDDVDLLQRPEEKLAREQDARRIAHAYEKSIENMVVRCRLRRIDVHPSESGSAAVKFALAAFFVVVAGGSVLAVTRPAIPEALVARIIGVDLVASPPSHGRDESAPGAAKMIFPNAAEPAVAPPAFQMPQVPLAVAPPVMAARPPVHVAERAPQTRKTVKAPAEAADGGEHFVVKVLQPDGSLKEQSFSSAPSR